MRKFIPRKFEEAITVFGEDQCQKGINYLKNIFLKKYLYPEKISLIPIMRGGAVVGRELAQAGKINTNPMRISYYDENNRRLEKPVCSRLPDIKKIMESQGVVFAEAVVESQGTIMKAIEVITDEVAKIDPKRSAEIRKNPDFFSVFAFASKIKGRVSVPNLSVAFRVHPDLWIHGWGCDNQQRGREDKAIKAVLSPTAHQMPKEFYKPLF